MNGESLDAFVKRLRMLDPVERRNVLAKQATELLVTILGVKWHSVADYAWSVLHCDRIQEKPRILELIYDSLVEGRFRTVDSRVGALNFLTANAARDDRAKAVYRRFLEDRSTGVASCAVSGSVWSLDEEAIPILRRRIASTSDSYIKKKFGEAVEAILRGDPRLMRGASTEPKQWGLELEQNGGLH